MTNMIERVAVAINQAMLLHDDYDPDLLARAAIAAMREPTDAMCDTLYDFGPEAYMEPEEVMAALIDAALEEKK
jgi:hypothetical protein